MVFDRVGLNAGDCAAAKALAVRARAPLDIAISGAGAGWTMIGRRGEGQLRFGSCGGSPGPDAARA